MTIDPNDGDRLVRIDELQRCVAAAFERVGLTPEDAEALGGLLLDSAATPTMGSRRSGSWPASIATVS